MKKKMKIIMAVGVFGFVAACGGGSSGGGQQPVDDCIEITGEEVTAVPDEVREFLDLDPFYKKYLDADGLPIISSEKVDDEAFFVAREIIRNISSKSPEVLNTNYSEGKVRLAIIAEEELLTDIPEYSDLYEVFPGTDWNNRARGLGATDQRPATSVGEENLLGLTGDRYAGESILIHEFVHSFHLRGIDFIDTQFTPRLQTAYENAMEEGLWQNTYAATNYKEYFAEGVESWFDSNLSSDPPNGIHNEIDTREELKTYDPELAELIAEWFPDSAWRFQYGVNNTICGN